MKFLIILSSFIFALNAKADFTTGLIVGSLFSSSHTEIKKDEFSTQVAVMNRRLPLTSSSYSLTTEEKFYVNPEDGFKYQSYFANKGFKTSLNKNELIIDLKSNYLAGQKAEAEREARWQEQKPFWKKVGWFALFIWIGIAIVQAGIMFLRTYDKGNSFSYFIAKMAVDYLKKNRKD